MKSEKFRVLGITSGLETASKHFAAVKRNLLSVSLSTVLAFAASLTLLLPALAQEKKPNIVFIFMDNFGWGEVGAYGGGILRGAPTPRIDNLAADGMKLLNFNVEAQCTSSRAAIMTGRYAIRTGNGSVPLESGVYGLTQ